MRRNRDSMTLILVLLAGALVGGLIGEALSVFAPILTRGIDVGLTPPVNLNLWVVSFIFGFSLKLNLGSAVGMILALLLYRQL